MKRVAIWLLAICMILSAHPGAEAAKPFIQEAEPSTGVEVGSFWYKESTGILYQATSISPITFAIYASADATVQLRKLLYPKATEYTVDYFPAPTSTQPGAVPPTGTPSGKFLKDDGTWATPSSGGVPAGLITFVITGTCPTGWTEVAALAGKTLFGTIAANADVGTTGGADAITPAGTISAQTFAGDALAGHAHGTGTYAASAHAGTAVEDHASHTHTYTQTVNHIHALSTILRSATTGGATTQVARTSDTSSTGDTALKTDNPDGGVATGTTAGPSATLTHSVTQPNAHTLSGSSESLTAGTPSGTVSQATFTGTGFDNRSAFVKAIFCSKD